MAEANQRDGEAELKACSNCWMKRKRNVLPALLSFFKVRGKPMRKKEPNF